MLKMSGYDFAVKSLEAVTLAAGKYRSRNLVKLRCSQDECQMLRRLFENFEQSIECRIGQHVHLVDDIHTLFYRDRGEHGFLAQLTDIVNTVVRCCVYLDNIENAAVLNAEAGRTFAAGVAVFGMLAVKRLGKDFCAGGLARAPRADKQVRMGQPVGNYLVFERFGNVFLPDDLVKGLGSPFPIQSLIHVVANLS